MLNINKKNIKSIFKNIIMPKYNNIINTIEIKINCKSCNGKGYNFHFDQIKVCKYCMGTGLKMYN